MVRLVNRREETGLKDNAEMPSIRGRLGLSVLLGVELDHEYIKNVLQRMEGQAEAK